MYAFVLTFVVMRDFVQGLSVSFYFDVYFYMRYCCCMMHCIYFVLFKTTLFLHELHVFCFKNQIFAKAQILSVLILRALKTPLPCLNACFL